MKTSRLFPVIFPVIAVFCLSAQQPRDQKIEVSGTIVNSASGQPLAGALVVFRSTHYSIAPNTDAADDRPAIPETRLVRVVTDASGKFSFEAQLPGSLNLSVSRQGFRSESNQDTAAITLSPEKSRDIAVRMVPQSVVQGRVFNSDGEPLQGITVQAVRIEINDGRRQLRDDYAFKTTDDRGEYRLWYLSPGSYYLKALGRRGTINGFSNAAPAAQSDEAYGPIYYPNAPDFSGAQIVKVGAGETISADFSVQGHTAYQIRGTLRNLPPRRLVAMRLLRGADALGNRSRVNVADGTFGVADVTPGSYMLQAYTSDTGPPLVAEMPVTVGDRDITGLIVPLSPGVDVPVGLEGPGPVADQSNLGKPAPVPIIQATPVNWRAFPRGVATVQATLQPGGGLVLKGLLPGKYEISVQGFSGSYAASVRDGTTDVLMDGMTIGAAVPDLRIRMQSGGGFVIGTIEGAVPDERWIVVLCPTGEGTPILASAFGKTLRTPTLAPGDYKVYAWPGSKEIAYREPGIMDGYSAYATFVSVKDGDNAQISVKPIPAEAIP